MTLVDIFIVVWNGLPLASLTEHFSLDLMRIVFLEFLILIGSFILAFFIDKKLKGKVEKITALHGFS